MIEMNTVLLRSEIAKNLKLARQASRLSQQKVANILHVNRSVISRLETGQRDLTLHEAAEFSAVYKKPITFFLGDLSS